MWRHNVAKRLQARVTELRDIWLPGLELSPRGHTLVASLRRIPACFWTGHRAPPLIVDDDFDACREAFFQWCDTEWRAIYAAICEMSNHGLSVWRIRIQDAMGRGDMATISQWFKIKTPAPMLKVDGQVISHPAENWWPLENCLGGGVMPQLTD